MFTFPTNTPIAFAHTDGYITKQQLATSQAEYTLHQDPHGDYITATFIDFEWTTGPHTGNSPYNHDVSADIEWEFETVADFIEAHHNWNSFTDELAEEGDDILENSWI